MLTPTVQHRETSPRAIARQTLAHMSLAQRVGQVFMLGFEGTRPNAGNRALIQGLHLGGVTLFGRNIQNGPQLARLDADLQTIADPVPTSSSWARSILPNTLISKLWLRPWRAQANPSWP
jgi:hypothetical protein